MTTPFRLRVVACFAAALSLATVGWAKDHPASGWLHWRGPTQMGVTDQANLPRDLAPDGDNLEWSIDLPGRGTPVIANYHDGPRLFVWGYTGEGVEQHEVLLCLDPRTGKEHWRKNFPDFLSDVIYERYSIGAPTVDAQTGNVYLMTTPGLLVCYDRDGELQWEVSMLEQFGRLTFPNGRTGAVAIDGDLAIVNAISSNWGRQGPARNRFYAFDKRTGKAVWVADPGVGPPFLKDSSFSSPVFATRGKRRVFYATLGDGNVVCVNAHNGEPIWRYQFAVGGVNSSVALTDDAVIAIHGKENVDDTGRGRMVALKRKPTPEADKAGRPTLGKDDELWRNDEVSMFTSSPALAKGRVYQLTAQGELYCIDAKTGRTIWEQKLVNSTLHASPLVAPGGVLYVPVWNDGLYVVKDNGGAAEVLGHYELAGSCIGSPAVWGGRVYVHTTQKLYCFKKADADAGDVLGEIGQGLGRAGRAVGDAAVDVARGLGEVTDIEAVGVRVVPNEFLLKPGGAQTFSVLAVNAAGRVIPMQTMDMPAAEPWIPPTARVKAKLDATWDAGQIVANDAAKYSAGAFRFTKAGRLHGTARGRILPDGPFDESFDDFELDQKDAAGNAFAYPPLPWIGARLKWEVRQDPTDADNHVLAKTLDRVLFMRSMIFFGHADAKGYTITADVMSDGNRRSMSTVGVICQRYIICLDGNQQKLRVYSNIENFNRARDLGQLTSRADFNWKPKRWYTIQAAVTVNDDGSGVVHAKAWPRDEDEPADWTLNVPVPYVHTNGSPGIFGLSPQSMFSVYVDNIEVKMTNDE